MLNLFTVGPKFMRPTGHILTCVPHVTSSDADIARRCMALLLPRATPGTDRRTERRTPHRFNTLTAYAVRVTNGSLLNTRASSS